MPVYDFTALDAKGKTVSGIIDADGAAAARQKIRSAGQYPVKLREVKSETAQKSKEKKLGLPQLFTRISAAEVSVMTRQLATLLSAGFPLVSALESLLPQISNAGFKKIIASIRGVVVEGSTFANALDQYPNVFSQVYINMVSAGESSGTLEIVLERLADFSEKEEALKSRLITALIYPAIILLVSILIVSFLLIYVTPKITSMFDSLKQDLPFATQLLIGISNLFQSYWWLLMLVIIALTFGARALYRNEKGRMWTDTRLLTLPLFGPLVRKLAAARFARTLGSLLDNGVSMLPALAIVEKVVGNVFISKVVAEAAVEVGKGQGLGKALGAGKALPPMAIQMIQVGEQSGNLEEMLNRVADIFEREVETTAMRVTTLAEPIMLVMMAVIVMFIVLAILLPIFEMNQMIA
ncbi:MAG: type II secretion system inner membrane protein GspF [Desulfatitalea sp.]|nr:type II secretion system inner membrane protein GspF [Desulfatitalea sp.]NNJ99294.1 type II secretion system inner membrane protein GspF [Desulfatitalea sp.]